jgi:putative redox protein
MEMNVYFPGNLKVNADFKGFTVETDQPAAAGGDGSAPAPFDLFLASLATCAGIFMLAFLRQRGLSTEGAGVTMSTEADPDRGMVSKIAFQLQLPDGFPEKYEGAIVRAVEQCTVKRHLHQAPDFEVAVSRALPA